MKKLFIYFAILFFVSCKNGSNVKTEDKNNSTNPTTQTAGGWSQTDKESFMQRCKGEGNEEDAEDKKLNENRCNCGLELMQKMFASYEECNKIIFSESLTNQEDNKKHQEALSVLKECDNKFRSKD